MQTILMSLMLMFAGAASAETITLGPDLCGTLKQCVAVPNDTGADVTIDAYRTSTAVNVFIDGVQYTAPTGNEMTIMGLPVYASDGSMALLTATFGTYTVLYRNGRGQRFVTHYNLLGGSIVR